MAKFWRSGMIDKKVVMKREQDEYINKLHRTILELSREEPEYATFYDDIEFSRKIEALENENYTRTLRQEE